MPKIYKDFLSFLRPCNLSFKTHNDLMDHMCLEHLPKRKKEVHHERTHEQTSQDTRPPPCRNGDQCSFHKQLRCSFFHPQPPQEQQYRPPGQQGRPRQQHPRPWHQEHRPRQHPWQHKHEHRPWQQENRPRPQAPSNEWQQMPSRRHHPSHSQGVQQPPMQQTQRPIDGGVSRLNTTTWCKHIHNCLQGRFCVLRQEGGQYFANFKMQRRQ